MSLIHKITSNSFTNSALPVLRRDGVANAGTLESFDALDLYSFAKQASPAIGTDKWKSLLSANVADFTGAVGFNAGFTVNGGSDSIILPSSFVIPASGKGVFIVWLKYGVQTQTSGTGRLFGLMSASSSISQWSAYINHGAADISSLVIVISPNGQALIGGFNPGTALTASRVVQLAVSLEIIGGVVVSKGFLNGALQTAFTSALTTVPQPSGTPKLAGNDGSMANTFVGKFYRSVFDPLTATTPEALVLKDYNANVGRFG